MYNVVYKSTPYRTLIKLTHRVVVAECSFISKLVVFKLKLLRTQVTFVRETEHKV